MSTPSREQVTVSDEWPMIAENDYRDAATVLRRSLSADARDDSCASDSGSQSHDEDAGTTSGSSSSSATNAEPSSTRLHATRYVMDLPRVCVRIA